MGLDKIELEKKDAPRETAEQQRQREWDTRLKHYEDGAKRAGGELRVYDIFDADGKLKPDARRVKVFPMQSIHDTKPASAFNREYVLALMTTTQMGNMKDGKLINEGQEPRPDKAEVMIVEQDGRVDRTLHEVAYNPDQNRWEMYPD